MNKPNKLPPLPDTLDPQHIAARNSAHNTRRLAEALAKINKLEKVVKAARHIRYNVPVYNRDGTVKPSYVYIRFQEIDNLQQAIVELDEVEGD